MMVKDRIVTDNTGRLFAFTHIQDNNFKKITTALRQERISVFENQAEKAAKGKIGFAIMYKSNNVILADYTNNDPVTGQYLYKEVPLNEFL